MEFGERYEGFNTPKQGRSPYTILDDPALIKKKSEMREALREEYSRRMYNPYRQAAGVGGMPFDPMITRYNAMVRTQTDYFRSGPRFVAGSVFAVLLPYALLVYAQERYNRNLEYKYRTGQIAHHDRVDKKLWA